MTAVDPINDPASATISREVQLDSLPTEAHESKVTPMERAEKEQLVLRIDQLPRDIGWLLIYVGALGFVLPGIIGTPFLIAGGAVLMPGGPKLLSRLVGRNPPRFVRAGIKQITRLLSDLDRRYPRLPGPRPDGR